MNQYKYLGIVIDNNLNLNFNTQSIINKINSSYGPDKVYEKKYPKTSMYDFESVIKLIFCLCSIKNLIMLLAADDVIFTPSVNCFFVKLRWFLSHSQVSCRWLLLFLLWLLISVVLKYWLVDSVLSNINVLNAIHFGFTFDIFQCNSTEAVVSVGFVYYFAQ